ncbi:MAG: ThuA domain-containing protein [Bacteroidales bacterium]|nr:ThuA domain-containing protein [Bacteroidales bacterium]
MTINRLLITFLFLLCSWALSAQEQQVMAPDGKIVVAYVVSWRDVMPDPSLMTHINYAFGKVNETFDGVDIDNPERLRAIAALKGQAPHLKVMLSVGGWGSGRFSEMAADPKLRKAFAEDCKKVCKEYGLDGIDIDWEYPTSNAAGISSSPDDTANFSLLMADLRKALGKDKLLTLATVASGEYIDFPAILPYIDFVNIMAYDMANAPLHHAPLYHCPISGHMDSNKAVEAHLAAGVPASKLVMGMPFYGRGGEKYRNFQDFRETGYSPRFRERWDETGKVPYLVDREGEMVFGYENPRSIGYKCRYIIDHDLLGGMYWEYTSDGPDGKLRSAVRDYLMLRKPFHDWMHNVVVLSESAGQHKAFTDEAIKWLADESAVLNFRMQIVNSAQLLADPSVLDHTDLVVQLDFPPYTWPKEAEQNFIRYIEEGQGGWIGFHHATLLGDFDGYPMWQWFSQFMGDIAFQNYIAPLADGEVKIEKADHPVMRDVNPAFVLLDDEWYTYNQSPRPNVEVLASVNEDSYNPPSEIKMGDHPVVWTNPSKAARNVYFQMGHSPKLFQSPDFTRMFHNALEWAMAK